MPLRSPKGEVGFAQSSQRSKGRKEKILPTTNIKQQTTNILESKERKVEYTPNTKQKHQTTNNNYLFINLLVIITWLNLSITLIMYVPFDNGPTLMSMILPVKSEVDFEINFLPVSS